MTNGNTQVASVERIDVVETLPGPGARWQPYVRDETLSLLDQLEELDSGGKARIRDEATAILGSCVPPTGASATETGLIIGQVQSGKTMSFTTVIALARDNYFPLVILITGTSVPLSEQSCQRVRSDLRLTTRADRRWQHFHNPNRQHALHTMQSTLADWRDPEVSEAERQTVLITVMKNHNHLRNLADLLRGLELDGVPALVIDDEADQAGLNNLVTQGRESTTYRRLIELRRLLPRHTYLQYTATPQAPLLINLIDILSPGFAEVLTPGLDYVGGRELFIERPDLVRIIPPNEIPTRDYPLSEPPSTLLEAMRLFVLGVAAGLQADGGQGNRSMMVHPSQQTLQHAEYARWVRETKHQWEHLLSLDDADPDRRDFISELRVSYEDLLATVDHLPDFDLLLGVLRRAIRRIHVTEVNAARGRTPQIDWMAAYSHILVGGQAMDRGFTVSGLTVTYMPRGVGVGNADTVWQRARFFGYKRSCLGFCRIYLETAVRDSYRHYVEHEEDIRARLIAHRSTRQPLSDWKRAFFLDMALQPTRRSVLDLDYMQSVLSDDWYNPAAPHDSEEAVEWNRQVVSSFLSSLPLRAAPGHPDRTDVQRHDVAEGVRLQRAYEDLLTQLRITRPCDSQPFTGLLLQVREYLDSHPDALCDIYRMSPHLARTRSLNENDEIPNLFQGAYPVDPLERRGSVYPGDRQIKASQGLTVQIHMLEIMDGNRCLTNVPTIAVWVPAEMARPWLVQEAPH